MRVDKTAQVPDRCRLSDDLNTMAETVFMYVNGSRRRFAALVVANAATLVVATLFAIWRAAAAGGIDENAFDRCRTISDTAVRLRCFEDATAVGPPAPQAGPPLAGGWRLLRTPNPQGGKDAVSIMHSAELSGSDPNFAALVFRCVDPTFQVLVVLIRPLPPRARPQVFIGGEMFQGSIVPPGAAVLLPPEASLSAKGPWQSLKTISAEVVEEDRTATRGLVSLEGLGTDCKH
jgi:hypothetical protein